MRNRKTKTEFSRAFKKIAWNWMRENVNASSHCFHLFWLVGIITLSKFSISRHSSRFSNFQNVMIFGWLFSFPRKSDRQFEGFSLSATAANCQGHVDVDITFALHLMNLSVVCWLESLIISMLLVIFSKGQVAYHSFQFSPSKVIFVFQPDEVFLRNPKLDCKVLLISLEHNTFHSGRKRLIKSCLKSNGLCLVYAIMWK